MMHLIIVSIFKVISFLLLCTSLANGSKCIIPAVIQGTWFSVENGQNTITELNATAMSGKGACIKIKSEQHVNYTLVFKKDGRYNCVKILVRTVNVIEKFDSAWVDAPSDMISLEGLCRDLNQDQQHTTLFSEKYVPVNCRSSLQGAWNFAYKNELKFTGECNHPDARIYSCQQSDSKFTKSNQKFNITYKKCSEIDGSFNGVVEYNCLGDWFVGKNHYFAVSNPKESRKEEKYRCFLNNIDDNVHIGMSTTADCNTLKSAATSPKRLRITPVKSERVTPGCVLPQNFSGDWIDSTNINAEIFINETHIVETSYIDEKMHRTIYVCHQQQHSQFVMARITVDGCQKDYMCFDFVPQRHNVIRFSKGNAFLDDNFSTVCPPVQFPKQVKWRNGLYLKKNPVAIQCPIAGRFNFTQKGDMLFETKPVVGTTLAPRPNTSCRKNISEFSVCDTDRMKVTIDENLCLRIDYLGRPVYSFSEPDYRMNCMAYWRENGKSYLITYDKSDLFSQYRCWVYQKLDKDRILMSQAIGSFCDRNQDAFSNNYTEGAAVHIELQEYKEQDNHQCPMHFDDGAN